VAAGDEDALVAALRRVVGDSDLRERLAAAAAPSVAHLRTERIYARLEAMLREAAAR
jgi:glycosyltransferase involved in cell wall biosynthesis